MRCTRIGPLSLKPTDIITALIILTVLGFGVLQNLRNPQSTEGLLRLRADGAVLKPNFRDELRSNLRDDRLNNPPNNTPNNPKDKLGYKTQPQKPT